MIVKILSDIVIVLFYVVAIYLFVKFIKKAESIYEKILFILLLFIYFVPLVVYILDIYDIPSKMGYTKKINSIRWFDFISNYVSTISGSVVSGVVLLLITIWQMRKQIDNNNDDKRIQNAPLLKYTICDTFTRNSIECYFKNEESNNYNFLINIENIGLNHARHLKFEIIDCDDNESKIIKVDKGQSFLEKNTSITINIIFNFKYQIKQNNNKNVNINIYYDDVLQNHYLQTIKLVLNFTNKYSNKIKGKIIEVSDMIVCDEELLMK